MAVGSFLCSPIRPKQPRTSFPFYKFFYPIVSAKVSDGNRLDAILTWVKRTHSFLKYFIHFHGSEALHNTHFENIVKSTFLSVLLIIIVYYYSFWKSWTEWKERLEFSRGTISGTTNAPRKVNYCHWKNEDLGK